MNYEREYDKSLDNVNGKDFALAVCEHCRDEVLFSDAHYKNREDESLIHEECFKDFIVKELDFKFVQAFGDDV